MAQADGFPMPPVTISNTGVRVTVGPSRTKITTRDGEEINIQAADWTDFAVAVAAIEPYDR